MNKLFEQLTAHLTAKQVGYWSNPHEQAICVDLPGIVGFYRIYTRIDSEVGQLQACGQARLIVPVGSRAAVDELVALANKSPADGNVEVDQEASELRFSVAEEVIGDQLPGDIIDRLIRKAHNGADAYLRAILAVIFGNELPADAIRRVDLEQN